MTVWSVVQREPLLLPTLQGHDDALWDVLMELASLRPNEWTLIGGQMVYLHALEHGETPPRVSTDLDVLVNARSGENPVTPTGSPLGPSCRGSSPNTTSAITSLIESPRSLKRWRKHDSIARDVSPISSSE